MDDRLGSLLDFTARRQAKYGYPSTPAAFARAANIKLVPANMDSANAGPPAIITYDARFGLNYRRFTLWHEIAHIMMSWHGIDKDFDAWLGEGEAKVVREQTTNLLAGQLMVPRKFFRQALKQYGFSPALIAELERVTGMSQAVCLRRAIFDDLSVCRAGAILIGSQVIDVTANNFRLPFHRYDRIPEPGLTLEGARLELIRKNRVIATWEE